MTPTPTPGAPDLAALGAAAREARDALRAAVRDALAAGMSEREAAARAGLNRETVRRIVGKRPT